MPGIREIRKKIKERGLSGRIHPVRRVNRVAPPEGRLVVAITFDDGPCAAPARPSLEPVTTSILDTLKAFGARGTFNVIGTTRFKYPDKQGPIGGPYWNGIYHDHYPEYGQDHLAGVLEQPGLARRMVDEGHELSNHGMTHTAFGPAVYPYAYRRCLPGFDAVLQDLRALHDLVKDTTGFTMRLGRPPHYIDKTLDRFDAYDAYRELGYLYLGACFDAGGWQASVGDFQKDVDLMVAPLAAALARDSQSLNGMIIFHKDGYNMSSQCPAVEGLKRQLALLQSHGYQVVTVSELLSISLFSDIGPSHPVYPAAAALQQAGYPIAYADNEVRPGKRVTLKEISKMIVPSARSNRVNQLRGWSGGDQALEVYTNQVVANAVSPRSTSLARLLLTNPNAPVPLAALADACRLFVEQVVKGEDERALRLRLLEERASPITARPASRGEAIRLLAAAFLGD